MVKLVALWILKINMNLTNNELKEFLNEIQDRKHNKLPEEKLLKVLNSLLDCITKHGECFLIFKNLPIIC